ncbi:unnamed protein product [Oikopleura dioica]|uniref:O-acyltransferase n=2 Tax=Oikopleura dioica TaxID=34765 RepID=E4XIR5_OIKDI|nr:unnamed protein product [Oikopleura dioica]
MAPQAFKSNEIRRRFLSHRSISEVHEEDFNSQQNLYSSGSNLPDYEKGKTKVCHESRPSLMSSASNWENYSGFINLLKVILLFANAKLFVENLLTFGYRIHVLPSFWGLVKDPMHWTNTWIFIEINIFAMVSLHIERLMAQGVLSKSTGKIAHVINCLLIVVAPSIQILLAPEMPIPSFISLIISIVFFLKMWSYSQANRWYSAKSAAMTTENVKQNKKRKRRMSMPSTTADDKQVEMMYPNNLTTANLYYFILAPTLCYEMEYPRTEKVRPYFLFKRLFETLFLFWLMIALIQQWLMPHLDQAAVNGAESTANFLHHLLAMSVANNIIWFCAFFLIFHSWLNFLAELLRFGDREFYRDWWNAQDVQYFWQAWNIPVHKWCVRHLYKPLLRSGYSKKFTAIMVFLFSAVMHEIFVSIPLQRLRFYSFLGMITQIPMQPITTFVTNKFGPSYGNMLVWTQIIIGQPLGVLAYVVDYHS